LLWLRGSANVQRTFNVQPLEGGGQGFELRRASLGYGILLRAQRLGAVSHLASLETRRLDKLSRSQVGVRKTNTRICPTVW
jgi:hypothetical protein